MHHTHTSPRRTRKLSTGGLIATLATAALITATIQAAPSQGAAPASGDNKHVLQDNGRALSSHAGRSDLATVKHFLRTQGASARMIRSLRPAGGTWTYRGVTHQRYEQRVSGLRVHDADAKAAFNARGQLIHLITFATPVSGKVRPADTSAAAALRATIKDLYPARTVGIRPTGRHGTTTTFDRGRYFQVRPSVERVAVPTKGAGFRTAYEVSTWDKRTNKLYSTLVSGKGRVVSHELRTANDSYNVFTEHPEATPQTIVSGPGNGNAQSPVGWLSSQLQYSTDITGNNVHAYLDAVPDNKPDPVDDTDLVTGGNFLTAANLGVEPTTEDNREVAVQNLFYLNNVIHDRLYDAGFTEAAGNFQEDNFTTHKGDSDSVDAEAQDGGGIDNANFATPPDGVNPRMQMYLWTGLGTHQVVVHTAGGDVTYLAQGAVWGAQLNTAGVTGVLAVANPVNACTSLTGDYTDKIVVADRGACDFTVKAKNVQNAGGDGLIVANNVGSAPFTMGGADASVTIPAVMVSQTDGAAIKGAAGTSTTIRLNPVQPLMRDGDLDSDIVWHEYGHGLTWRMIGKMSGTLAGAIGEGMADVLAVIANEDDRVGEYSSSDPFGIRSMPYDTYNRTYDDVDGTGVHFDGEVYGAIGWRLFELYQAAGVSKSVLLADLVDGMNYTPREPAYEDMRDGILSGLAASGNEERSCMVWDAFAEYGVGVGADGVDKGKRAITVESFDVPAACQP